MATAEDDGIEILSCHIEHDDPDTDHSTTVSVKIANGDVPDDPVSRQRKRVARAVGIVTFILLLFSIVLIGVSLNMSKNIDEMVRQASERMRHNDEDHNDRLTKNSTQTSQLHTSS